MPAPTHTPVDLTDEQRANLAKLAAAHTSRDFFPSDAQILRGEAQLDFEQCDPCEGTGVLDSGKTCPTCFGEGTISVWSLCNA